MPILIRNATLSCRHDRHHTARRARHLSPARKVQRITEDHDTLIQRAVAATGRTRQEIVNDALDVGMTLVLLQVREPHAARALVAEASYLVVRAYVGLAAGGGPGDRYRRLRQWSQWSRSSRLSTTAPAAPGPTGTAWELADGVHAPITDAERQAVWREGYVSRGLRRRDLRRARSRLRASRRRTR